MLSDVWEELDRLDKRLKEIQRVMVPTGVSRPLDPPNGLLVEMRAITLQREKLIDYLTNALSASVAEPRGGT